MKVSDVKKMVNTITVFIFSLFLVYPLVVVFAPNVTELVICGSGIIGGLLCICLARMGIIRFSWAEILLLALLLYNFVGILKYHYLPEILLLLSVYIISKLLSQSTKGGMIILVLFLCMGMEQLCIGGMQCIGWMNSFNTFFLMTGSFNNPAIWGGFLAICLSFLIGQRWMLTNACRFVMLFLLGIGIAFSGSRAAWMGSFIAIFYVAKVRFHISKKHFFIMVSLFSLFFLLFSLFIYKPVSAQGRLLIWQVCMEMVKEHPFTGSGLGTFASEYMVQQANFIASIDNLEVTKILSDNCYAFNEFLHIACEQGLVGLVLIVSLLAYLFHSAADEKYLSYRSVFIMFFVFACFSYPFSVFLVNLQIAVLLGTLCGSLPSFSCPQFFRFKRLLNSILMLFITLLVVIVSKESIIKYRMEKALELYLLRADMESLLYIQSEYPNLKYSRDFVFRYARILYSTCDYELAIPVLKQAIFLYPTTEKYCDLGKMYEEACRWDLAVQAYKEAVHMVPHILYPYYCMFMLYKRQNKIEMAKTLAIHIMLISPKNENADIRKWKDQAAHYLYSLQDSIPGACQK